MKVAVLGVGLIGGSIGLAARRRLDAEVVGFDRDATTLERALELGALDRAAGSVAEAVSDATVVFCAAPVGALPELVAEALAGSGEPAVVTDVGSTKRGADRAGSPRTRTTPASSAATRSPGPRPPGSRTPAPSCSRGRAGT